LKHLRLDRPLAVFDLETTGIDPAVDRIVEISVLKISPDGAREARTRRINPERPIPADATRVHGIRDQDVAGEPTFRQLARGLLDFLGDADLGGFNVERFDIPLLDREFRDCNQDLGLDRRRVIDAMRIYHRKERRDLTAAVAFFLGRDHAGAHSAEADVVAAADVLEAQLERYADLPHTVPELADWIRPVPAGAIDRAGKFAWAGGQVTLTFGKHRGQPLAQVIAEARDYLDWLLEKDFPPDAAELVRNALEGRYPDPPAQST